MENSTSRPASSSSATERWDVFLEMAVTVSRASGGAIWNVQQRQPVLVSQHQLGSQRLDTVHEQWPGHVESLDRVIQTGKSQSLEAKFEQASGSRTLRLLLFPILAGHTVENILELFLPEQSELTDSQIESSVQQLLVWATPSSEARTSSNAMEFATWLAHIYQHLDVAATCYTITNETRLWSGWDRLSLLVAEGKLFRLKSVSGVDALDPRSTTVSTLESVAQQSLSQSRNTIVSNESDPKSFLQDYHDRTQAKQVALIPLLGAVHSSNHEVIGLLVCDRFEDSSGKVQTVEDLEISCHHIAVALEHALRYENVQVSPLRRVVRRVFSRRFVKSSSVIALFVLASIFLSLWPATLTVTGTGFLEPQQARDVFAISNGLIEKLHVTQGETVAESDELLTLRSPELDLEINRIQGELTTVRQQIDDLVKIRSDPRRANEMRQSSAELAARGEELKTVETGLQRQLDLMKRQAKELILRSPMSGEVISSNLESILSSNRPVTRTDRLLRIADLTSDWIAKLHVDHRDIGPVLEAYRSQTATVTFLTADAADSSKEAILQSVAPSVSTDAISGSTLVFDAEVKRSVIPDAKPGTTILFRIDCGKAPIGYVWFRRLIDRLHGWWTLR